MTITIETIREQLAKSVGGEARFAQSFSQRTMSDLNKRAARELDDGAAVALDMLARIEKALDGESLGEFSKITEAEWIARYVRFWAAWQAAGSRTANWMITGPARFPVASNNKKMATEDRRYAEFKAFYTQAPARAVKRARNVQKATIGASGIADAELIDLQNRHAERVRKQAMMTTINAIIRKNKLGKTEDDARRLAELAREANHPIGEALALSLLTPDWGNPGFASFSMSNNNAEIRRLEKRIAQVKAKVSRMEAVEIGAMENKVSRIGEIEIVENFAEDRLQIIFPGKPDAATRDILKRGGYRWSPRNSAWQRQLTNNARYSLSWVTDNLAAKEALEKA